MEFIFPVIFGFICSSLFFLYLNGYFELLVIIIKNIKLINKTMRELNITPELIDQYASIYNNLNLKELETNSNNLMNSFLNNSTNNKSKNQTYISKIGKCIHIYYDYEGKEYMLTVPFDMISLVDMLQYQMDAIYENGDIITITQQPGIPYLVSSRNLGCKTLKAINHETGVYHEYKDDTKPHFCGEICDI